MDAGYGARYAELYRRHWWWRAREEYLTRIIERHLPPPVGGGHAHPHAREAPDAAGAPPASVGDVLDFGCGDGLFFDVLRRFGTPHGIEPDGALLDPHGPWRARISSDPLVPDATQAGRFRLIVALDVLEHIADPRPVVHELAARLAPGGLFVATVPAFQSLWTTHDDLNHHVKRYRVPELEALVRAPGLRIVESRYFFVWLALAKWVVVRRERLSRPAPRPPAVPPAPFNLGALWLSRLEQRLVGRSHPPFGSSALVVARK